MAEYSTNAMFPHQQGLRIHRRPVVIRGVRFDPEWLEGKPNIHFMHRPGVVSCGRRRLEVDAEYDFRKVTCVKCVTIMDIYDKRPKVVSATEDKGE